MLEIGGAPVVASREGPSRTATGQGDRFGLDRPRYRIGRSTSTGRRVQHSRRPCGDARFAASFNATRGPRCDAEAVPLRCLIVDDNASFLHAAATLLERQGITVAASRR